MRNLAHLASWGVAVAVAATVASIAQPSLGAAEADSAPVVNDCTKNQPVVQPNRMLLACGDGGVTVKDITWSSWGSDTAQGDGTVYSIVCVPSCAGGHEVNAPTHITLDKLANGYYTEALITGADGKPETWPLNPPRNN
ncbi:hypothetical protein ACIP5Y_26750 [Nocardia sp. NPDC088792]|uniref:hypothetical protein n=1 Tax=Nocardia sp. NPDC088792 TaxID=3364332 RepID=UPI003821473F